MSAEGSNQVRQVTVNQEKTRPSKQKKPLPTHEEKLNSNFNYSGGNQIMPRCLWRGTSARPIFRSRAVENQEWIHCYFKFLSSIYDFRRWAEHRCLTRMASAYNAAPIALANTPHSKFQGWLLGRTLEDQAEVCWSVIAPALSWLRSIATEGRPYRGHADRWQTTVPCSCSQKLEIAALPIEAARVP
jgi:hypothetical protein